MTVYVLSLEDRPEAESIWLQVREEGLWTYTTPMGRAFRRGDEFFVWWPDHGWLARLLATADSDPKPTLPRGWIHERSRIRGGFRFTLVSEMSTPVRIPRIGELQGSAKTIRPLPSVPEVTDPRVIARLCDLMPERPRPNVEVECTPVAIPGGGWSTDQARIKQVEEAAVAAVRAHLRRLGWTELRDCQRDGVGYDLLYRDPTRIDRPVEVKGSTSRETRFILTAKEHKVITTDVRARIFLVNDALGCPIVQEIDVTSLEDLDVRPDRWAVRPRADHV